MIVEKKCHLCCYNINFVILTWTDTLLIPSFSKTTLIFERHVKVSSCLHNQIQLTYYANHTQRRASSVKAPRRRQRRRAAAIRIRLKPGGLRAKKKKNHGRRKSSVVEVVDGFPPFPACFKGQHLYSDWIKVWYVEEEW